MNCNTGIHTTEKLDNDAIANKIDSLLQKMTIAEKVGQMNLYNGCWDATGPIPEGNKSSKKKYEDLKNGLVGSMLTVRGVDQVRAVQKIATEETRLGIPLIIGFDVIHGYKTMSPIPLAEAASWDLKAIEKSARIAAEEASASGINWTFAPMVDISRDARWGRVMEGAGEDPFLGSKIAVARIKGFQGDDLSKPNTIAACAKHFAAYGFVEAGKEYNTVEIGGTTLHNVVLPPFKAAVKEANVRTLMNSFSEVNGIPSTGDSYLQRDLLKGKWEFDGFIVSDWASVKELVAWGYAKSDRDAAVLASKAGCDMDMEGNVYVNELIALVKDLIIDEKIINDAVKRILRVKFELGLFDDPYRYCNKEREKTVIGSKEILDSVLDIAKKSIVLLKNENNLLPIKKTGKNIAIIGPFANDNNSTLGSWRIASKDNTGVSLLDGMKKYKGNKLTYAKGAELITQKAEFVNKLHINKTDKSGFEDAKLVAKNADLVIIALGEHGFQSGEGRSRTEIDLPGVQQELLEAIYKVNKNIVLVLNNGRPLSINWADKHIPAIVEGWQLGTQSGHAIAQVLYGDYNPSGKLPMTFPRNVGQIPIYYNHKSTGRPTKDPVNENLVFWSHYTDSENTPLYPFGYGLSYTTFRYSNLRLNKTRITNKENLIVSIDISNTGTYDGKEVVQMYIQDLHASVTRPVKELKGFELLALKIGETKTVSFILNNKNLGFYNSDGEYITEAGIFNVFIGKNSAETLKTKFQLD